MKDIENSMVTGPDYEDYPEPVEPDGDTLYDAMRQRELDDRIFVPGRIRARSDVYESLRDIGGTDLKKLWEAEK